MKSLRLGFLLLVLTLGGVCLFSCDKESEDEDGLGASRPIYEDYAQGYSNLNGTTFSKGT